MKARQKAYYMDIAKRSAEMSYAVRLKVGACAVKGTRIISTSWNGTPSGTDNCCEYKDENGELRTKDCVLHAEENLILKAAADGESTRGAVLFITHAPCIHCARMIYGAQFSEVYFNEHYRSIEGVEFLESVGVKIEKYENIPTPTPEDLYLFQNNKETPTEVDEKAILKKKLFDDMNALIENVISNPVEVPPETLSDTLTKFIAPWPPQEAEDNISIEQFNSQQNQ